MNPSNDKKDSSVSNNSKDNTLKDNDLSNDCSLPVEGARSKVKTHFCNIPNGRNESAKLNNFQTNSIEDNSIPSTSGIVGRDMIDKKINGLDHYLTNNVDNYDEIDKCPSKVNGGMKSNFYSSTLSNGNHVKETDRDVSISSSSSSSSGNEGDDGMSTADDCCIYTYKGDQLADLPDSFFNLDVVNGVDNVMEEPQRNVNENRSRGSSSPEMDFLEMDFDPGPSLEQDSGEEFEFDRNNSSKNTDAVSPLPELPNEVQKDGEPENICDDTPDLNINQQSTSGTCENDLSRLRTNSQRNVASPDPTPSCSNLSFVPQFKSVFPHSKSTDSNIGFTNYTLINSKSNCVKDLWGHHVTSGDLCSPGDSFDLDHSDSLWTTDSLNLQTSNIPDTRRYNLFSAFYHWTMAKKLVMDKETSFTEDCESYNRDSTASDVRPSIERTMIWSEQEACNKQITQISTSACGATAVMNVVLALNMPVSFDKIKEGVKTRLRCETAQLPAYLHSRSEAGSTHDDLIRAIDYASNGAIYARFFHMYPMRNFSLSSWLLYWIRNGAIPIATLNLQNGVAPENPIPDAWHHQMVFGISSRGVYLTNPIECVEEDVLRQQLCSDSVLKIKRDDVVNRWSPTTDLKPLMNMGSDRWKRMNVLGQVVNVIRESRNISVSGRLITQHISIPASYSSGVTLVLPRDKPAYQELTTTPELPVYTTSTRHCE